jgi:hypothetical protein
MRGVMGAVKGEEERLTKMGSTSATAGAGCSMRVATAGDDGC